MTNILPPRQFELGQYVWVQVGELIHYGRVFGYEDGRNLSNTRSWHGNHDGPYPGWAYHVALYGIDGEKIEDRVVKEEQLQATTTG